MAIRVAADGCLALGGQLAGELVHLRERLACLVENPCRFLTGPTSTAHINDEGREEHELQEPDADRDHRESPRVDFRRASTMKHRPQINSSGVA